MKTKAKPRLKKGPEIQDYVCETIAGSAHNDSVHRIYNYFDLRADARAFVAKESAKGFRVRVFKISYRLVSDSKKAGRK